MENVDAKHIEEFFAIAQRTHLTIKRLLDAGNYEQAMHFLEQCQNHALSFGHQIEAKEGSDSATIALLEEYCESVYQMYEKLRCFLPVDPNYVHNSLAMQLIRIRNSIFH